MSIDTKELEPKSPIDIIIDEIHNRIARNSQFQADQGTEPNDFTAAHRLYNALGLKGTSIAFGEGWVNDREKGGILAQKTEIGQLLRKYGGYNDTDTHKEWRRSDMSFTAEQDDGFNVREFNLLIVDDGKRDVTAYISFQDDKYTLELEFDEGKYSSGASKEMNLMTSQDGVIITYYLDEFYKQLKAHEEEMQKKQDVKMKPILDFVGQIDGLDEI